MRLRLGMTASPGRGETLKSFRESLLTLSSNLIGLTTGFILVSQLDMIEEFTPYLLLFYPGILSIRGVITGIFSGNLSTKLHLGTIRPSLLRPSEEFRKLFLLILVSSLVGSLSVFTLNSAVGLSTGFLRVEFIPTVMVAVFSSMYLSVLLVSPLTASVAFTSFRIGLDPDKSVYPAMSAVSDVIVTSTFVAVIWIMVNVPAGGLVLALFSISLSLLKLYLYLRLRSDRVFSRNIKEMAASILGVTLLTTVSGLAFARFETALGTRREIYLIYPAVIACVGDVGSIVGSVTTTKLFLGVDTKASNVIVGAWAASIIHFIFYSVFSSLMMGSMIGSALLAVTIVLIISNLMSISAIVLLSLFIAKETYKRGLDPDNFVNPFVSTFADMITTLSLFLTSSAIF